MSADLAQRPRGRGRGRQSRRAVCVHRAQPTRTGVVALVVSGSHTEVERAPAKHIYLTSVKLKEVAKSQDFFFCKRERVSQAFWRGAPRHHVRLHARRRRTYACSGETRRRRTVVKT